MDFELDARIIGLRAMQEEIVDRAGWDANLGWKRRHGGASVCGIAIDLARALGTRWITILKVGPTPALIRWEVGKLRPVLLDLILLVYFAPVMYSLPKGKRMIRKKRILRYNYGGFSKYRAPVAVAR